MLKCRVNILSFGVFLQPFEVWKKNLSSTFVCVLNCFIKHWCGFKFTFFSLSPAILHEPSTSLLFQNFIFNDHNYNDDDINKNEFIKYLVPDIVLHGFHNSIYLILIMGQWRSCCNYRRNSWRTEILDVAQGRLHLLCKWQIESRGTAKQGYYKDGSFALNTHTRLHQGQ